MGFTLHRGFESRPLRCSPRRPQTGLSQLRELKARAVTRPHFDLGGSIVSTAAPIAAAVRLLARGQVQATGVHPPERCIDPELMFAELETRACAFGLG
jgi:hypothetical protein